VQWATEQQPVTAASAVVAVAADGSGGVRWLADQQQQQQQQQAAESAATSSKIVAPVLLPVRPKLAAKQTNYPVVVRVSVPQPQQQLHRSINPDSFWVQQQQQQQAPPASADTAAAAGRTMGRRQLLQEGGLSQKTLDVWTHLIWAVQRSGVAADGSAAAAAAGGAVELTDSQLLLPQPEFARLLAASRSSSDGSFSLPLVGESPCSVQLAVVCDIGCWVTQRGCLRT
jgi:hypothetical protein